MQGSRWKTIFFFAFQHLGVHLYNKNNDLKKKMGLDWNETKLCSLAVVWSPERVSALLSVATTVKQSC